MPKKIIIFILVTVNTASIGYAVSPLFVTFAQIKPENIEYSINDKHSVDRALIKTRSDTIESMREFFRNPIYLLSGVLVLNTLFCGFLVFRGEDANNT